MRRLLSVAFLLLLHACLILSVQRRKSPTYDEAFYPAYGYSLWKTGDFRMGIDKPPLVPLLNALPLVPLRLAPPHEDAADWEALGGWVRRPAASKADLDPFLDARWNMSLRFLYANTEDADRIVSFARLPVMLLSCLFALGLYLAGKKLWGDAGAMTALLLYVFSPNILAHASLSTEDLAVTGFMFLALYAFWRSLQTAGYGSLLLCGLFTGLALASKFTAFLLAPCFLSGYLLYRDRLSPARLAASFAAIAGGAFLVVGALYGFTRLPYYFYALKNTALLQGIGQQTYLWGKYSAEGFRAYYPAAFLAKTTVPALLLAAAGLLPLARKKLSSEANRKTLFLLVPVLLLFAVASFSKKQIGLRYLLPVYPLVFLIAARRPKMTLPAAALLAWHAFSSAHAFPDYLAYFNELSGGQDRGYTLLLDSNVDWGQDLKGLKKYVRENGRPEVILSYYGACLPSYVGFPFQDLFSFGIWGEKNCVLPQGPEKELLAVSVTNLKALYLAPLGRDVFSWLEKKEPVRRIGHSLFVYDITRDAEAHRRLAHIYFFAGQDDKARREAERALALTPGDAFALFISAALNARENRPAEALAAYRAALSADPRLEFPYPSLITTPLALEAYSGAFASLEELSRREGFEQGAAAAGRLALMLAPSSKNGPSRRASR